MIIKNTFLFYCFIIALTSISATAEQKDSQRTSQTSPQTSDPGRDDLDRFAGMYGDPEAKNKKKRL